MGKAMGKHHEAEPLFRHALEGREVTLGPTHPDTLTSLNNLAMLLKAKGQHQEAEPLLRRTLEGCEATLGPTHPGTLTSLNNLAILLKAMGKAQEAESLLQTFGQIGLAEPVPTNRL